MTYVSVAEGQKSGGFNSFFVSPADSTYDPEHSWNYELGLKSSWFDNRMNINVAAFFVDWDDQQIVQFLPPDGTIIRNAGRSTSKGIEFEMVSRPISGFEISAGLGVVDAEFDDYDDPDAMLTYDGKQIPVSQDYNFNLAAQYNRNIKETLGLFGRVELNGVGEFYWDPANTLKEDPYQLVDVRAGIEGTHWEVSLWANNVFDEEYAAIALQVPGFPAWGQAGNPRTVGVTVKGSF